MYPDQAYSYWRRSQAGAGGQTLFLLGLKPETAAPGLAQLPPPAPSQPESPPVTTREPELEPPPPPASKGYPQAPSTGNAVPGSLDELKSLLPKAGGVLQYLETDGWTVSDSHTYDRPGQRFSRDFVLANPKYPELAVKILYLPSRCAGHPQYRHHRIRHR